MKKSIFLPLAILAVFLALTSCQQAEENGQLTLGLDLVEENMLKAASSNRGLTTALISIMREDGSLVYDKEPTLSPLNRRRGLPRPIGSQSSLTYTPFVLISAR